MQTLQYQVDSRWRQVIETGDLGVWDLRPELETVHYSPQWKQRLGFPEPHRADSTHFWRCRVHPDDLEPMLAAIQEHMRGGRPGYEAAFRVRSNGSGYRRVHSRGRVIERGPDGRATRMIGTMIDLTGRPSTPQAGLPDGPRDAMQGLPPALPFHTLLSFEPSGADLADAQRARIELERDRVLALASELLDASVAQLDGLRA